MEDPCSARARRGCRTAVRYWPTPTTSRWCSSRSSTWPPPRWPGTRRWPGSRAPPAPTSGSPPPPRPGRRGARGPRDPQGAGRRPRAAPQHVPHGQRQPAHPRLGPGAGRPGHPPRPAPRRHRADRAHPVHDLAALRRQTDELRARGALIALDDAGSGYSGLQQLAACGRRSSSSTARWSATPTPTRCGSPWPRCSASSPAGSTPGCSPRASRPRPSWPRSPSWASRWRRAGCSAGRDRFAPLAPEATRLVRAQVARARLTDTVASLLRPVRQSALGEDVPACPRSCWSVRRANRSRCCSPTPGPRRSTPPPSRCACTPPPTSARPCSGRSPGRPPSASTPSSAPARPATSSGCCASRTSRPPPGGRLTPPDPRPPSAGRPPRHRQGVHP